MREQEAVSKASIEEYPYQLTCYLTKRGLRYVVRQIEKYEGKGKGYRLGERGGKWAVFTKGDMVVTKPDTRSYRSPFPPGYSLLQYRSAIQKAKRGA